MLLAISKNSSLRSVSTSQLIPYETYTCGLSNGSSYRDLIHFRDENTNLEVGFPLRCFQRLSTPHIATQRLPLAR
jgi:hypothetical protein